MSSETRQRSKCSQDMSQDSNSDQDRKDFNRKHNVRAWSGPPSAMAHSKPLASLDAIVQSIVRLPPLRSFNREAPGETLQTGLPVALGINCCSGTDDGNTANMPRDGMPDALVVAVDKETALESSQPSLCIQDGQKPALPFGETSGEIWRVGQGSKVDARSRRHFECNAGTQLDFRQRTDQGSRSYDPIRLMDDLWLWLVVRSHHYAYQGYKGGKDQGNQDKSRLNGHSLARIQDGGDGRQAIGGLWLGTGSGLSCSSAGYNIGA